MQLFTTFGPMARPMEGTIEMLGDQATLPVGGAEDFEDAYRPLSIRTDDNTLVSGVLFYDEEPAGLAPGCKVRFTLRALPRESVETTGMEYAVNGRTMQMIAPRAHAPIPA